MLCMGVLFRQTGGQQADRFNIPAMPADVRAGYGMQTGIRFRVFQNGARLSEQHQRRFYVRWRKMEVAIAGVAST